MKKALLLVAMLLAVAVGYSQTLVVISDESRLFDQPNAKSYSTTNTSGVNVVVSPGMVFNLVGEPQNGWLKIEYTPGLNAYMLQSQTAKESMLGAPRGGRYAVANNPGQSVEITDNGGWKLKAGSETLNGFSSGNAVVFKDRFGNTAYSLAVLGGKPMVFNYNNDLTKFF